MKRNDEASGPQKNSPRMQMDDIIPLIPHHRLLIKRHDIIHIINPRHEIWHHRHRRTAALLLRQRHDLRRPDEESIRLANARLEPQIIAQEMRRAPMRPQPIACFNLRQVPAQKLKLRLEHHVDGEIVQPSFHLPRHLEEVGNLLVGLWLAAHNVLAIGAQLVGEPRAEVVYGEHECCEGCNDDLLAAGVRGVEPLGGARAEAGERFAFLWVGYGHAAANHFLVEGFIVLVGGQLEVGH